MSLIEIRRGLLREVGATGNVRAFDEASARHAALAACASAAGVHAALKNKDASTFDTRERIVCALVAEQKRAPRALWLALLGLAFEPMLGRLEWQSRSWQPADEPVQVVLAGFVDAVKRVSTKEPTGIVRRLSLTTRRLVVSALNRDRRFRTTHVALADDPLTNDDESPEQLVVDKNLAERERDRRVRARRLRKRRRIHAQSYLPDTKVA
jgi:hypothetical protein